MPAAQPNKEVRVLCFEHHAEMGLNTSVLNSQQEPQQTLTYTCPEPECQVHYSLLRGYFFPNQNGNKRVDMLPDVRCLHDGTPLYLVQIDKEKRAFRLWLCPQCGASRTNKEDLVGSASEEVSESAGKCGAQPQTPRAVAI